MPKGNLEMQESALEFGKENLDQDMAGEEADRKLLQDSIDALQALSEGLADQGLMDPDYSQMNHDTTEDADDADDEFDTDDDDFVEILPLNIKKAETGRASDKVHPSPDQPKLDAKTTAHPHDHVKWADNLAQAEKTSTEASHTAQIALDHISPRAPTPFPEPHSQFSDLLHPSPPLRRRKGSNALREDIRNNPTTHSMMPNSGWTQDPFRGQIQDHAADNGEESNTYQTPTKHGKMPEARDSLDAFFGEEHDNTAKTDKYSDFSTIPETQVLKPKSSNLAKAHAVLGYGDGDEVVRKKSTTDLAASVKATPKKKFFRNFFKRKGSKEPTTPPSSSSGNTVGRKVISAPTLIDASPNAKALLNSASSLVKDSPSAKKVVNFSRPLTNRSTSDVSTGSPVGRGRSNTLAHGSSPFSGASTIPGEFTGKSGVIPGSPHTSRTKNVATEKKAGADDADSFDPSGHSGNENSARQTVAVPIILSRRTRQVDIPPRRRIYTAASGSGQLVGTTVTPCTLPLTDSEAEALGAQDAERYYRNASRSQTRRMNIAGDGPSIDPAYQNLVAKPANEIAANEMARIKAAREEVVSEAQAEVEHGLREEKQIHEMIKARMAARAAASGFVNGAEMPRIDYGEPDQSTALGASGPTNEERAHARALTASRTAG